METRCPKCEVYGLHAEKVFDMTEQEVKNANLLLEKEYPEVNARLPGPLKVRLTRCHNCGHKQSYDISPPPNFDIQLAPNQKVEVRTLGELVCSDNVLLKETSG